MTPYLQDPSVRGPYPDGTYTIPDPADVPDDERGEWTIRKAGNGWEATHPDDGFSGAPFATAEDAARAVLGDPAKARRVRGTRVTAALHLARQVLR